MREILAEDWRSHLPTPPHPDFPSGHSAAAAAGAQALRFVLRSDRVIGANCAMLARGMSGIEPAVMDVAAEGLRSGRTDVANGGARSVGFSPTTDVTVCWRGLHELADMVGELRVLGGLHTRTEVEVGAVIGRRAAWRMKNLDAVLNVTARA